MRIATPQGTATRSRPVLAVLLLGLACAGCPDMAITRGAEFAAGSTFDDRSYEQQASDEVLHGRIDKALLEEDADLAANVNIDVYRSRVMLTGTVGRPSDREIATSAARNAGAEVVYDDLQLTESGGLVNEAADFAADKELGAALLAAEGLASQSYEHRVVNGVAYILGQASEPSQVETARQTALDVASVERVVLHIDIRE